MQLSPHFHGSEFITGDPIPAEALPMLVSLCMDLLEPIRAKFGVPLRITSGYRSPEHNRAVGGVETSQHVATSEHCACDFTCAIDLQVVFDWIRLSSGLAWDQCIIERDKETNEPRCIHISLSKAPRREAMEGATHNQSAYMRLPVGPPKDLATETWNEG